VDIDHHFHFPDDLHVDIPTTYTTNIDVTSLPTIKFDAITINPLTIEPVDVSVRIKEIPSIRAHIPANFAIGLSFLGYDIACVRLCGEAQVITEPYEPNPCEHCGRVHRVPTPVPLEPSKPEVPK
jgi:hypothetical protein